MWHLYLFSSLPAGGCLWMAEKPFVMPNKEIRYLWDTGNPQPILNLSVKETIIGNNINAPILSFTINASKTNNKTWVDRVDEFSLNLNEKNAFSDDDGVCFFIIKRNENDFSENHIS